MKEFTLKNRNFLLVEVPDDAYEFAVGTHCIGCKTNLDLPKDSNGFYHVYGRGLCFLDGSMMHPKHIIIGKLSDILKDEHICRELVESFILEVISQRRIDCGDIDKLVYENYLDSYLPKSKATDSFNSFLQSQQIDLTKIYLLIEKL